MPLDTGSQLGPYVIKSALGAGGMGEVYRAFDTRLKRFVAVKVLPGEISDDPRLRARFEREARAVAALSHPNIVTVFDFGESAGKLYIAFELIDGQTLQQRLSTRTMPVDEVLDAAAQIADGLAHAHDAGVIHRDLKPRNIMFTAAGLVKILDFGLGKFVKTAIESAESATASGLSEVGQLVGTIGYMSPEQVTGSTIDARSDQFVFGALVYEMLSGKRAFQRDTVIQTMTAIIDEQPAPLSIVAPKTPAALGRLVGRCLAKRPEDRYDSMQDLAADIRSIARGITPPRRRLAGWSTSLRVGIAAVAIVAAGAAITFTMRNLVRDSATPRSAEPITTLSLLPIETDSGDPAEQAYWAGLTQAVTTRLAALPAGRNVYVVPATDVTARGVRTPADARVELGATHVIRGKSARDSTGTRADLELVDAASGATIRRSTITVAEHERAALQNRIVDTLLSMIDVTLTAAERNQMGAHPAAAGAHDFYLQGLGYLQDDSKPENVDTALAVLHHALELDPRHAPAHAGLGEAYWKKYLATKDAQWVEKARQTCERALGLDEQQASPHQCLGTINSGIGEYEKAVEEFQHALAREPENEMVHIGLASAYDKLGLKQRAEETYLKAIDIRPRYWSGYSRLGAFYYAQSRYADAEGMFRQVVTLHPDSWRGYSNLGALAYRQERPKEAIAAFEKSLSIRANYQAASNLGTLYFFELADYARAAQAFQQAVSFQPNEYVVWGNLASAQLWAGQSSESRSAFTKAAELADEGARDKPARRGDGNVAGGI